MWETWKLIIGFRLKIFRCLSLSSNRTLRDQRANIDQSLSSESLLNCTFIRAIIKEYTLLSSWWFNCFPLLKKNHFMELHEDLWQLIISDKEATFMWLDKFHTLSSIIHRKCRCRDQQLPGEPFLLLILVDFDSFCRRVAQPFPISNGSDCVNVILNPAGCLCRTVSIFSL